MSKPDFPAVFSFLGERLCEVRVIGPDGVKVFYPGSAESFAEVCEKWNGGGQVYVSVNERDGFGGSRENVTRLCNVVLDLDAVRPDKKVQGATGEELRRVLPAIDRIRAWYKERGFQAPLVVCSGNGFQLWSGVPPVDLNDMNRDDVERRVEAYHRFVKDSFEDPQVCQIDNLGDLPRVIGVPFTLNRKERETPDRPARVRMPEDGVVPARFEDRRLLDFIMSLDVSRREPAPRTLVLDEQVREAIEKRFCDARRELWQRGTSKGERSHAIAFLLWDLAYYGVPREKVIPLLIDYDSRTGMRKFIDRSRPEDYVEGSWESASRSESFGKSLVTCERYWEHGFCGVDPSTCLFRRMQGVGFDSQLAEKARQLAESPTLLRDVKQILDEEIVREAQNKLLLFLLNLSGKRRDPHGKQIVILKGEPGGGKSHLGNKLTALFKTKKRGRFSEHALDYSDLQGYEVLYIQELGGMDEEKYGISTLRFLSSEDQGYTVEITVRDPKTGRFSTEEYRIPPITVNTTTTKVGIESQLARRAWEINVDETEAQTEAILGRKAGAEAKKFRLLTGEEQPSRGLEVLRHLVNILEDMEVICITPETLKEVFPTKELRVRGDYDKLLELTKLIAYLHQHQRPHILVDDRKIVFTLPQDAYNALVIAQDALLSMVSSAEKRVRDSLPIISELTTAKTPIGDDYYDGFTLDLFAERLGKSLSTARRILGALVERSVLRMTEPRGRIKIYRVNVDKGQLSTTSFTSTKMGDLDTLSRNLEKEAESFFSDIIHHEVAKEALAVAVHRSAVVDDSNLPESGSVGEKKSGVTSTTEVLDIGGLFKKPLRVIKISPERTGLLKTPLMTIKDDRVIRDLYDLRRLLKPLSRRSG